MLDLVLLLGLSVVGACALWLVAQAIILDDGLLEQALEWFVDGTRQDATLSWPWEEPDHLERR